MPEISDCDYDEITTFRREREIIEKRHDLPT